MNFLKDWGDFIKRNSVKWDEYQTRKCLKEAKELVRFLEEQLRRVS